MRRTSLLMLVLALMAFTITFAAPVADAVTLAKDTPATQAILPAPILDTATPAANCDHSIKITLTPAPTNTAIVSAVYQQAFLETKLNTGQVAGGSSIEDIAQSVVLVPLDDGHVAVFRITKVQVVQTSTFAAGNANLRNDNTVATARSALTLLTASTAENLGNNLLAADDTAMTATRAAPNANLTANADTGTSANLTAMTTNTGPTNARAPNIEAVACMVKTVDAPKLKVEKVAWADSGGLKYCTAMAMALKQKAHNYAGRYQIAA